MRLILKKWKICFVPRRYWVENLHWMKGRQAIQPDIRIDYDFLREVEIYVPDIEYRTCFCSSQDIGESWWPSKCCEWTFGLKPGYQQVRELVRKQRREKLRPRLPQIFLIRIFRIGRDPPPFWRKIKKKSQFFSDKIPPFWQNMPKNLIFSDKTILDWVRPPPLCQKNLSFFW